MSRPTLRSVQFGSDVKLYFAGLDAPNHQFNLAGGIHTHAKEKQRHAHTMPARLH